MQSLCVFINAFPINAMTHNVVYPDPLYTYDSASDSDCDSAPLATVCTSLPTEVQASLYHLIREPYGFRKDKERNKMDESRWKRLSN